MWESKIDRKLSCKGRGVCAFLACTRTCVFDQRAEHRARTGNEVVVPPVRGNRTSDKLLRVGLAGLLRARAEWTLREDRVLTGRTVCLTQQEDKQCTFFKIYFSIYTQHFNVKLFFLTLILVDYEQKQNRTQDMMYQVYVCAHRWRPIKGKHCQLLDQMKQPEQLQG